MAIILPRQFLLLAIFFLSVLGGLSAQQVRTQGFERSAADNFLFVATPSPYNVTAAGADDFWVDTTATNQISPASGNRFWYMLDLENPNGGGAFFHNLDFEAVDVSAFSSNTLTFKYYTIGYEAADSIGYILETNNGTGFNAANYVDLNRNTTAWTTVTINFPAGTQFVRLRLRAKQNGGSDYAGFDDVTLISSNGDVVPPTVLNATATSATTIQVVFTEGMDATAEAIDNYTGIAGLATATRNATGDTVTLTYATPFAVGSDQSLTVQNVQDAAGNALAMPFVYSFKFNNSLPGLVITEINYNPPSNDPDILEFVEIYNNGTTPAILNGLRVEGVIGMNLPDVTLAPTGIVLIAQNKAACDTFFEQNFYQWSSGVLTNGGNTLVIRNSLGAEIDRVVYDDAFPWPLEPDGTGPSLELLSPNFDNNNGANWRAATTQVDTFNIFANPGVVTLPSLAIIGFDKINTVRTESNDTVRIAVKVSNQTLPLAEARVRAVSASTAIAGQDYVLLDTVVTFPLGATTPIEVRVALNANTTQRDSRYVIFQLTDFVAAEAGAIREHALLIGDNDTPAPSPRPNDLVQLEYLSSFEVDTVAATAEITAYDPASKRLFITNTEQNALEIVNFANPLVPQKISKISLDAYGGGINSVAVHNGLVAVAIEDAVPQNPGRVVFFDANGGFLNSVTVGALPDMVAFSPDGSKVLTANEGEPATDYSVDPEGSVSVVDLSGGVAALTNAQVTTIGFSAFNADSAALVASGVRIYGVGSSVAQDLEPEYIAIAPDGLTAWATLQENNAIAIIDLTTNTATAIVPLGTKMWSGSTLDVADNLSGGIFFNNWNVRGMYQPDAIAHFGGNYLITANEGDAREYDALEEIVRLGSSGYVLDPVAFPDAAYLKRNDLLGRLNVTNQSGDTDGDGDFDEIHTLGGRSISIWDATTGALVWDSGDDFERITAADPVYGALFNASNSNNTFKNRSDDKGPEPEGVTVATIEGRTYAFVTLERIGGIMLYDVTAPTAPVFVQYINTRALGTAVGGDLGPEGIIFIPKNESPNGRNLVVVSNEISGTVSVFQLNLDKTQTDYTLDKYAFDNTPLVGQVNGQAIFEGGVSGLHYRDGAFSFISDRGPNVDASSNPNATNPLTVHFPFPTYEPKVWNVSPQPNGSLSINSTASLLRPDGSGMSGLPLPVGQGNTGEVAWSDTSGTVLPNDAWGIDSEGLVQDNEGNWWVCDEYGTSIYQLDANFKVIRRYTPFPAQPEDAQLDPLLGKRRANRGLEGIAYTPNGKIFAILQSPANNPTTTVGNASRIHRLIELDPATGATRTFVYVHDPELGEIRSRDWKIGDLAAINNEEFLVLEHAERNGWNAKNVYQFSLAGATPVVGDNFGGLTLEQLSPATLAANGITPVTKTFFADLLELGWERQHDKPEGLAVLSSSSFAVVNDNDFGVSSPAADGNIVLTNKTTRLYVYGLPNGQQLNYVSPYCDLDLGADVTVCGPLSTTLSVDNQGFAQAEWSSGSNTLSISPTQSGTYSVVATTAFGCVARDTVVLVSNPQPNVNLGPNAGICANATRTLDAANAGATYAWSNAATTQIIVVATSGTYTVTVTAPGGCTSTDDIVLNSLATPTANLGADQTTCSNDPVVLNSNYAGASILWSNGATTPAITADATGTYAVSVTFPNGCSDSDTTTVTVLPTSVGTISVSACAGSFFEYNGTLIAAGDTQQVVLQNIFGCDSTVTVVVGSLEVPSVSLGPDSTICDTASLVLNAGAANAYLWNTGASTGSITVGAAGTYTVTVTNAQGCTASDAVVVTVEICSSTDEPAFAQLNVYPNPTTGLVTLQLAEVPRQGTDLRVFNVLGQVVIERQVITRQQHSIDLGQLPRGVFYLHLQSGRHTKIVRVVVQ
jgi:hypothetical protein